MKRIETSDFSQKSKAKNKWVALASPYDQNGKPVPLEERLFATYAEALKPETFNCYVPIKKPYPPSGFEDHYKRYLEISGEKKALKSEAWVALRERYSGYYKKCEEVEYSNNSDKALLNQMKDFFEAKGDEESVRKIKQRLNEFEVSRYA